MGRIREDDEQVAGQDSFLDVVANIVGILILLVMVVGLRTAQISQEEIAETPPSKPVVTDEQLRTTELAATRERARVADLLTRVRSAKQESAQADAERVDLASYVAAAQDENEQKKQRLSESQRRDVETRRKLNTAQLRLEDLTREQVSLASLEPRVKAIESLPTPLAKTVKGDELHIRLAGGSAVVIPLDKLLDELKVDAEANLWRLESRNSAEMVVGPIEGFRLRYSLVKFGFTSRSGATGTRIQLERWRLLPDATAQGESVEQALQPGSQLMQKLKQRAPDSTTVTIWTYPDSFNEFRSLKRALYDLGYPTAGRPLPDGVLIGGSPSGTQSAAQ